VCDSNSADEERTTYKYAQQVYRCNKFICTVGANVKQVQAYQEHQEKAQGQDQEARLEQDQESVSTRFNNN
jgi:hypothetical protein